MASFQHVTDTAHAVAAGRAIETERSDGVIRDPFAATLAGEKGMALARSDPATEWMSLAVGMRDRLVDELLVSALRNDAIETVVNLGAGLDARPWRLGLPSKLRWIEVDFEDMLAYKTEVLRDERPRCQLERMAADILLPSERERIFRVIGDRPALMITEGLLMYLPKRTLEALCTESAAKSGVRWWILDVFSRELMHQMRRFQGKSGQEVESLRPKDHLAGKEIIDLVASHGWQIVEFCRYAQDAVKLARERLLKLAALAGDRAERFDENDPSGVYLFRRS